MAEIYRKVKSGKGAGRQIQQAMGLVQEVQDRLALEAKEGAYRADALLRIHRNSGDSRIVTESGRIDHYVILDDTRGLKAALSIEYGRKAVKPDLDDDGPGPDKGVDGSLVNDVGMKGLFILHDAMKLSRGGAMEGLAGGDDFDE